MRENRVRNDPGAEFTEDEKRKAKKRRSDFVKKRERQETADEKVANAKRNKAIPRLASLYWIRDFDHALQEGLGHGLSFWIPNDKRAWDDDMAPGEEDPGCLTVCMDQQQVQWCAAWFLSGHLDMQVNWIFGPVHRRSNDIDKALSKAGYYGSCLLRLFELNIAYGPWANGAIFGQMREQALDLVAGMSSDDALLAKLWPRICEDKGWRSDEETNSASRQKYIDDFASLRMVQFKGPRASTSRWCSLLGAMRQEDTYYHDKLLLMASLCCDKGWASSWDKLFTPSPRLLQYCGMQDEAKNVPRELVVEGSRSASSCASAPSKAPAQTPQAKQSAATPSMKQNEGQGVDRRHHQAVGEHVPCVHSHDGGRNVD